MDQETTMLAILPILAVLVVLAILKTAYNRYTEDSPSTANAFPVYKRLALPSDAACRGRCGLKRIREVICVNTKTGAEVEPSLCAGLPDPVDMPLICPPCSWDRVEGKCSTDCGTGTRKITHVCSDSSAVDCGTKPADLEEPCTQTDSCEKTLAGETWVPNTGDSLGVDRPEEPNQTRSVCTQQDGYHCEPNRVYTGMTEMGSLTDVDDVQECARKCDAVDCEFFSHNPDYKTCYMKRGRFGVSRSGGHEATYTNLRPYTTTPP
jgi:hypothetical protein